MPKYLFQASYTTAGVQGLRKEGGSGRKAAVERAIEYIYAGDIFQANLSQRLLYPQRVGPLELYLRVTLNVCFQQVSFFILVAVIAGYVCLQTVRQLHLPQHVAVNIVHQ